MSFGFSSTPVAIPEVYYHEINFIISICFVFKYPGLYGELLFSDNFCPLFFIG